MPVYKGDDDTDPSNYRPFSYSSSSISFLKKKKMYNRLKSRIKDNKLLYKAQYGFREKFSTQNAILDMMNNVYISRFSPF